MAASRIMLIRHAEEAGAATAAANLNEHGLADAGGLSVRGWQRAGALVRFFAPTAGHAAHAHLAKPAAVFAMDCTPQHPTRRPACTVGPLAQTLALPVRLVPDEAALLDGMRGVSGPALVCWRHRQLPALAHLLAPKAALPPDWPAERNDVVWIIQPAPDAAHFWQVPQLLLPGDSRSTIPH